MRWALIIVTLFLVSCDSLSTKKKIGETAYINVDNIGIDYLTRIDTGAKITSIHAINVKVKDEKKDKKDNIGKMVTFDTINHAKVKKSHTTKIIDVAKVSNSQGTEYRYEVEMNLSWKGVAKKVKVNLRDRSKMTYKLLIGRNWLMDDYIVDVNMKAEE